MAIAATTIITTTIRPIEESLREFENMKKGKYGSSDGCCYYWFCCYCYK